MKIYVVYSEENHIVLLEGAFHKKSHAEELVADLIAINKDNEEFSADFDEIILQ